MIQRERQWQPVRLGDDVPTPAGAYSPAARAGGFVFVSGQVPRDPSSGKLVGTTSKGKQAGRRERGASPALGRRRVERRRLRHRVSRGHRRLGPLQRSVQDLDAAAVPDSYGVGRESARHPGRNERRRVRRLRGLTPAFRGRLPAEGRVSAPFRTRFRWRATVQSVRSLIVAGSLLLSAVAIVPAQQPNPHRAARACRRTRVRSAESSSTSTAPRRDAQRRRKTNLQAVRASTRHSVDAPRSCAQAQNAKAARQRGDTAALRSIRTSLQTERQTLAQAERNDVRNALTPANQATFDSTSSESNARREKPFKARRLSNR